jgi:hypothetical protein
MTFHPRARHRIKPFGLAALTVAALALGAFSAAGSEYRLRAGDVIECLQGAEVDLLAGEEEPAPGSQQLIHPIVPPHLVHARAASRSVLLR